MCFPTQNSSGTFLPIVCGGAAILVLGTITMLVMGILGATGTVPMARVGAEIMVGLSTGLILIMIGTVLRCCCR